MSRKRKKGKGDCCRRAGGAGGCSTFKGSWGTDWIEGEIQDNELGKSNPTDKPQVIED